MAIPLTLVNPLDAAGGPVAQSKPGGGSAGARAARAVHRSGAGAVRANQPRRVTRLAIAPVAILIAIAGFLSFRIVVDDPHAVAGTTGAPIVGSFTGEYVDGVPVYRLPPIDVVGSRTALD